MKNELYEWQKECLNRWHLNSCRGIVQAVTGSGKTLLALSAMDSLEHTPDRRLLVRIVVPTTALMLQWKRALTEYLLARHEHRADPELSADTVRRAVGLRGGGFQSSPDCRYLIYVINSARYELARQILAKLRGGEDVLLIVDECHHCQRGQNQLIFDFLPYIGGCEGRFFSLGPTASLPAGEGQRYLCSVLGRKIYHYGVREASAENTISPFDIYHISLSFQNDEREEYEALSEQMRILYARLLGLCPSLRLLSGKENFEALRRLTGSKDQTTAKTASSYMNLTFLRKQLVSLAASRISCARKLIRLLDPDAKIIVFSERIRQADDLYHLLQNDWPGKAGRCHSKMGAQANKNTLERFRTGSIRILITCKSVDEGLNVPDVSVGIILSGTSTKRQRLQRLGRIIRKKDTPDHASLYYLHVTETSEESCYLPDAGSHRLAELAYDGITQRFINPPYDCQAAALLLEMEQNGADPSLMREAERCLQAGRIRLDWQMSFEALNDRIQNAGHTSERNYWVCMKKLKNCASQNARSHSCAASPPSFGHN